MALANLILIAVWVIMAGILAVVLLRGYAHRRFPFFFMYAVYSFIGSLALLAATTNYRAYFFVFWCNEAALAILAVLALFEIFSKVFLGAEREFPWFRFVFPGVMLLALAVVVWQEMEHPPADSTRLTSGILLFALIVNFIQLGIFLLFLFLAHVFPLKWRLAPLGILLGFALAAAGSAIYYWLRSTFGTNLPTVFSLLPPVAYLMGLSVWLHTFLNPEPEPEWTSAVTMRRLAEQMQRETEQIRRFLDKFK